MNIDARLQQLEDDLEAIHGQRLHGRLAQADWDTAKAAWRGKAKALIAEVVEAVAPPTPKYNDPAYTDGVTHPKFIEGYKQAIFQTKDKQKGLGL